MNKKIFFMSNLLFFFFWVSQVNIKLKFKNAYFDSFNTWYKYLSQIFNKLDYVSSCNSTGSGLLIREKCINLQGLTLCH